MSIIKKISDCIYYYLDSIKINGFNVKIEHFMLNHTQDNIIVVYRVGRQKLLNKMELSHFEKEYFEKASTYDQHRLTKFSTLLYLLQNLFSQNICNKNNFTRFIKEQVSNEQFF